MKRHLKIGSRGSPLALWQAQWVRARLMEQSMASDSVSGIEVEIVEIHTKGDKVIDSPLSKIGDKGLFTREIETALLEGRIDLAVHSLKDLPTSLPGGLAIAAVCEREDPRDALVSRKALSIDRLPQGGVIATGSLRRRAQLLHLRPDLQIVEIRGNVGTRLRKLDESTWDGLVMARAGLIRLGLEGWIACVLESAEMLPAVAQGALAIETREDNAETNRTVARLDHAATRQAVTAERSFLRALEGGCQAPIGALAVVSEGRLRLEGILASLDGSFCLRDAEEGACDAAESIGQSLAIRILNQGGKSIMESIRNG